MPKFKKNTSPFMLRSGNRPYLSGLAGVSPMKYTETDAGEWSKMQNKIQRSAHRGLLQGSAASMHGMMGTGGGNDFNWMRSMSRGFDRYRQDMTTHRQHRELRDRKIKNYSFGGSYDT